MPASQKHCPYDGRWLGRPHDVCARPQCENRLESEVQEIVRALQAATVDILDQAIERRTLRAMLDEMRLNGAQAITQGIVPIVVNV